VKYSQGEEDFADFLLSFLTFPFGAVVHILERNSSLGCIDTLHKSITNLDENKYYKLNEHILQIYESRAFVIVDIVLGKVYS